MHRVPVEPAIEALGALQELLLLLACPVLLRQALALGAAALARSCAGSCAMLATAAGNTIVMVFERMGDSAPLVVPRRARSQTAGRPKLLHALDPTGFPVLIC